MHHMQSAPHPSHSPQLFNQGAHAHAHAHAHVLTVGKYACPNAAEQSPNHPPANLFVSYKDE